MGDSGNMSAPGIIGLLSLDTAHRDYQRHGNPALCILGAESFRMWSRVSVSESKYRGIPSLPSSEHSTALGDIFNERRDTIPTIMPVIYI